ncbi:MAG: NINE protein [Planctomycetes bacterium]|nr:NINE protein [Planctomycetota bacterium]
MSIALTCPKCQATLRVGAETAGRTALCPQCNAEFQVPEIAAAQVDAAEPPAAAASSAAPPALGKFCQSCGSQLIVHAEICPQCGAEQLHGAAAGGSSATPAEIQQAASTKIAAGICGIFLGYLGIHKFIMGRTTEGVIMLLVSVLSCGFAALVMSVIGIVEGIIYLTKSDEDFYQTYIVEEKGWF